MKRSLLTLKIALALLLGIFTVKLLFVSVTEESPLEPERAGAASRARRPSDAKDGLTDEQKIEEIAEKMPFGVETSMSEPEPLSRDIMKPAPSAASKLDGYKLVGTIAGSESMARAMIETTSTGQTLAYKTGDTLGGGIVAEIGGDFAVVMFDETGEQVKMTLGRDESLASSYQPITSSKLPGQTTEKKPDKKEDERLTLSSFLQQVDVQPYTTGGYAEGLQLKNIEDVPGASELGLKNGDIVRSVNGQVLVSKPQAFQVLTKAKAQDSLKIRIKRGLFEKDIELPMSR